MKSKFFLNTPRVLLASATILASAGFSFAAPLQWDADGVGPLGGTGTWDTSNSEWFNNDLSSVG